MAKEAKKRDGRIPLHQQKKIGIEPEKSFIQRLVTDNGTRIDRFKKAGWEIVEKDGKVAKQDVGNGDTAYYMRIPKKYYHADQKEKQDKCDEVMDQIGHTQRGMLDGIPMNRRTGKVTIN
jgi:hypothetical protein